MTMTFFPKVFKNRTCRFLSLVPSLMVLVIRLYSFISLIIEFLKVESGQYMTLR